MFRIYDGGMLKKPSFWKGIWNKTIRTVNETFKKSSRKALVM